MPLTLPGRMKKIKNKILKIFLHKPEATKQDAELRHQRLWKEFSDYVVLGKLQEYWTQFRYLDKVRSLVGSNKWVLDVGCGCVTSVLRLADSEKKYGIDPLMKEYARIYALDRSVVWIGAVGEAIPFRPESFDLVFCTNVLDHVDNPLETMKEIRRVLKPERHLVLTVDVFPQRKRRSEAHPFTFLQRYVDRLLRDFNVKFMRKSGRGATILAYLRGIEPRTNSRELIVVAQKREAIRET